MKPKPYVGIYLGEDFASAALAENKKPIRLLQFSLTPEAASAEGSLVDKATLREAVINRSLRQLNPDVEEIRVSLADKDFIFRSFEMPLMNKNEISSALRFEIGRSIPFKIEELIWDYSYVKIPKQRKINVSFLGIRNTIYENYKELFSHLNFSVVNVEASAFSLVRIIQSLGVLKKVANFALLDFSDNESYITFFSYGLPIFNRYLSTSHQEKDGSVSIEKMREEIRISIQYYEREFKNYKLDKLFILCNVPSVELFATLREDVSLELSILTAEDILKMPDASVAQLKAYATATSLLYDYKFKPILLEGQKAPPIKDLLFVDINYGLIGATVGVWALAGIILVAVWIHKLSVQTASFKDLQGQLTLPVVVRDKSLASIKKYYNQEETKTKLLGDKVESVVSFHPIVNRLPYLLTDGLWLEKLKLQTLKSKKAGSPSGLRLDLSGYVFLDDEQLERESLDSFIMQLKDDESFKTYFENVRLVSIERDTLKRSFKVFKFSLHLE